MFSRTSSWSSRSGSTVRRKRLYCCSISLCGKKCGPIMRSPSSPAQMCNEKRCLWCDTCVTLGLKSTQMRQLWKFNIPSRVRNSNYYDISTMVDLRIHDYWKILVTFGLFFLCISYWQSLLKHPVYPFFFLLLESRCVGESFGEWKRQFSQMSYGALLKCLITKLQILQKELQIYILIWNVTLETNPSLQFKCPIVHLLWKI